MALRRLAIAALAAGALAGCDTRDDVAEAVGARDLVVARLTGADRRPPFRMPSRAELDRRTAPLLYVAIPALKAQATLNPVAQNGPSVTWLAPDGVTLSTRGGLIVATRGVGYDLMSADLAGVRTAISEGGAATRVHYRLDGENRTQALRFSCTYAAGGRETLSIVGRIVPTQRVVERCEGPAGAFTNRYWVDAAGRIAQSRQWLVPQIGAATTQRLVD